VETHPEQTETLFPAAAPVQERKTSHHQVPFLAVQIFSPVTQSENTRHRRGLRTPLLLTNFQKIQQQERANVESFACAQA
jgi:hypothetical protein